MPESPRTARGDRERYPYHRRYARHKVRVRVEVDGDRSFSSWTINVSREGLCFDLPVRVALDRHVEVRIYLSRGKEARPLSATARVVWNQPSGKSFRHGGEIVAFAEGDAERLAAWLGE